MFKSLLITIILAMSSVFTSVKFDDSFYKSNLDAESIVEENKISTEEELYNYVLDYSVSSSTTFRGSSSDSSKLITNTKEHLENEYGNVEWRNAEIKKTSDVSNAIPLNMKGPSFPSADFDEAVRRSGISSSYGGCGSIAMVGILDYFARYLGYNTIIKDPYDQEDRIRLVTDVFMETKQWNLGSNTIVFPEDYKKSANILLRKYGLDSIISTNYKGTLLFGGKKEDLLKIIVDNIDKGLPVTMYTGLRSGKGEFAEHYTNIYGYEKYIGFDNNGKFVEKYLLEARLNWSYYDGRYFCDDNILDTGMMGIIYYDVKYNKSHTIKASDFSTNFVNGNGQGQYFFYNKSALITTASGYSFNTNRLRCSYIENRYLVLSSNRNDVIDAYLEFKLPNEVHQLTFNSSLWSGIEGITSSSKFSIQILNDGVWQDHVEYDISKMSTQKSVQDTNIVLFKKGISNIRFYVKHVSPSGVQNKGRIVLDNIKIQYNN